MRQFKRIVLLSATTFATAAQAQTISYEGNALPTDPSTVPQWAVGLDDTGGTGASVSNGILTISTQAAQSLVYSLEGAPGGWDPTAAGSTIDVRMKVDSQDFTAARACDMHISTGTQIWFLRFGANAISEETFGGSFLFNTTDAFHDYRFTIAGTDGPLNVYIDGNSTPYISLEGVDYTGKRLKFGDEHYQDGGVVQWDHIRWTNTGAFPPVNEPTWLLNGSGDWNVASNWGGTVPNAVDAKANLLGAISSPRTIYSDSAVTVGALRFNNASTYQIAGNGSLSIDVSSGSGSIAVEAGNHKINIPLFINDNTTTDIAAGSTLKISNPMTLVGGATLTKTGDGTLSIEAPVTNAAPATIASAGGVTSALMDLGSNTSVQTSGGTTNLQVSQHLAALDVTGGIVKIGPGSNVVVVTKSLSISGSGQVDLQNSKLAVDYTGASVIAGVKSAVSAGSLTSSQLISGRVIGVGEASDLFAGATGSFAGETVDSSTVVAAFTIVGDASLDGTVSSADFNQFAAGYGTLANARWTQGDFDGDGKVTTTDFNILAGNFGQSLPASASLGATVPEPTSAILLGVFFGLARRRR